MPECRFCHNTDPLDLVTDMTTGEPRQTYCFPWCGLAKTIPSSSELEEA